MIRPVIAIVGRPNVGKSTLFNRLVGRRSSLVRDVPGVTRDRLYGTVAFERWQGTAVDTGGFEPDSTDDLVAAMRAQIMQAIEEADLLVFTVDAREGITPVDEDIARILRRSGRPVVVAANKVDGGAQDALLGEVHRLGFPQVQPVSAEHGLGKRKAHLLALQYSPEHLETMRAVKRRLDPRDILGRGTIWAPSSNG